MNSRTRAEAPSASSDLRLQPARLLVAQCRTNRKARPWEQAFCADQLCRRHGGRVMGDGLFDVN